MLSTQRGNLSSSTDRQRPMLYSSTAVEWWVLSITATVRGSTALVTLTSCSCRRHVVWTRLNDENPRHPQSTNLVSASWTPSYSLILATNHPSLRSRLGYAAIDVARGAGGRPPSPRAKIQSKCARFSRFYPAVT